MYRSTHHSTCPPPVRTSIGRCLLPPPSCLPLCPSCLPALCAFWYPYPTADPGHTLMPTSKLFFPLHQTNAQLASSRGYKSKLPLHRPLPTPTATIQNIINACSCSKVGSSANSLSNTAAQPPPFIILFVVVFLDALSEVVDIPPSPTSTTSKSHHITYLHPAASQPATPRLASIRFERGLLDIKIPFSRPSILSPHKPTLVTARHFPDLYLPDKILF